ncbi:MAG: hypothetical protein PHW76_06115, partial [Alphaproteobacteria bacterium]|nr:hypothetical protein [Alphaproteobacteria bacterium]
CLKVYKISKEFYEDNKYGVGRANYSYSKNGEFKVAAVTLRTQNQAEPVNPRSCIINANDILRAVQAEERRCQRPGFKPRKKVVLKNPRNGG